MNDDVTIMDFVIDILTNAFHIETAQELMTKIPQGGVQVVYIHI